jgi:hypothetical protein
VCGEQLRLVVPALFLTADVKRHGNDGIGFQTVRVPAGDQQLT